LKQTLVIDQDKRMGWKDLLNHPLFQEKHGSNFATSVIADIPIRAPLEYE